MFLELANLDFLTPVIGLVPSLPPCESSVHFLELVGTVVTMTDSALGHFHFPTRLMTALEGVGLPPVVLGARLLSSSFSSSSLLLLFSKASRYPCCPLTLLPRDPPPVLMYAFPIVPFSGELLDVPDSHPLSAPETEDSMNLIIPAPPLRD